MNGTLETQGVLTIRLLFTNLCPENVYCVMNSDTISDFFTIHDNVEFQECVAFFGPPQRNRIYVSAHKISFGKLFHLQDCFCGHILLAYEYVHTTQKTFTAILSSWVSTKVSLAQYLWSQLPNHIRLLYIKTQITNISILFRIYFSYLTIFMSPESLSM